MEEQQKPWSGLAIASLALGVLSLGLGFLTGIPAVVCGHLGRWRNRKSGGGLQWRKLALAGLILGYGMTVLSLTVSYFAAKAAIKKAQTLQSKTDAVAVMQAAVSFYQEYSKLPEPGANDFNTEDPAGRKLLSILLGPDNPSELSFLWLPGKHRVGLNDESGTSGPVAGLYDAWKNPYRVILDDDYDEVIRFTYCGKPEVVYGHRVLVASKGPDGIEGTEDDLKSW